MTPNELHAWQLQMGFTQKQAAEALGVSLATFKDWLNGTSRNSGNPVLIDKRTGLACAAITAGLLEYSAQNAN